MAVTALCLMFFWAGCAGRGKPYTPDLSPRDAQCHDRRDRCLVGTPSNTGDTKAPYEWTCLGRHGGANASCSRPTASFAPADRFFAGEANFVNRVKAAGPLRGKLVIDGNEEDRHGIYMKQIVTDIGIPEENLVVTSTGDDFFFQDEWKGIRDQALVIGHPNTRALELGELDISLMKEYDILHVAATGNNQLGDTVVGYDLWYPEHPWWESHSWENSFKGFATGKLIIATFATVDERGNVSRSFSPNDPNAPVRCGLAMEYCYSVPQLYPHVRDRGWNGTSSASSALSALSFYLFQLWETPQEVVGVLNVCAEDVGEPGIDEEYGRGLVSVVCDTVRDREVRVVTQSLQVSSVSPVFDEMTQRSAPSVPFRPFFSLDGTNPETMTGHLGGEISVQDTDFYLSAGTGWSALGIHSSLLPFARTPFMEFGTRRAVFTAENHRLFLLGTYGYSGGDSFSARVGHVGTQYQYGWNFGVLSVQVGHRLVHGTVGIPGHREAGAAPVPFVDGNPEVRFLFTLR